MHDELINQVIEANATARAALGEEMFPSLPSFVMNLDTTEAQYVFEPRAVPFRHLSFPVLRDSLEKAYGLSFDLPSTVERMAPLLGERGGDPDEIGSVLLSQRRADLQFRDGLLRTGDGRAITISRVTMNFERVNVNLEGPTTAAEHFITELLPLMWACVGVKNNWQDLQKDVQAVHYGTATSVQFPDQGMGFLSRRFRAVFSRWCEPGGLAPKMGDRYASANWEVPENARSTVALDELHLVFERRADRGVGADSTVLRFSVRNRADYGTGRMAVVSELPLPEHLRLLEDVIGALTDDSSDNSPPEEPS